MKNIFKFCLFLVPVLFISCALQPEEERALVSEKSFENWSKKIKLNLEVFESETHDAFVDIYVNKLAKEAYEERLSIFPVGSEVYKPLYNNTKKENLARVVIMIKMKEGYDSKNGDWWYGVTDRTGKELWHEGRIQHCIDCHALAKETDYMFSESVMEEIKVQKELREEEVHIFEY
ncbi:MAG: hypothetical protein COA44_09500 [Arcobacter sp.]|nr:MAG: hypothetical protein COA44_09500 [Arcobacter sp.]